MNECRCVCVCVLGATSPRVLQQERPSIRQGTTSALTSAPCGPCNTLMVHVVMQVIPVVARALARDGFSPAQVRQLLASELPQAAAAGAAAAAAAPPSAASPPPQPPRTERISPVVLAAIQAALGADGFSQQHLVNLLASDGQRLDPDYDPEGAARAVATLAAAGFGSDVIRLFLVPGPATPALTPLEFNAMVGALQVGGGGQRMHTHRGPAGREGGRGARSCREASVYAAADPIGRGCTAGLTPSMPQQCNATPNRTNDGKTMANALSAPVFTIPSALALAGVRLWGAAPGRAAAARRLLAVGGGRADGHSAGHGGAGARRLHHWADLPLLRGGAPAGGQRSRAGQRGGLWGCCLPTRCRRRRGGPGVA